MANHKKQPERNIKDIKDVPKQVNKCGCKIMSIFKKFINMLCGCITGKCSTPTSVKKNIAPAVEVKDPVKAVKPKSPAKKTAPKKTAAKKAVTKKTEPKKATAKKTSTTKTKAAAKSKSTAKKTAPKKTAAKK